jgi:hypothetical protein
MTQRKGEIIRAVSSATGRTTSRFRSTRCGASRTARSCASVGTFAEDLAAMSLSAEHRQALELLAGGPHGRTKGRLFADGFTVDMLADLVSEGLARRNARP